MNAVQARRHSLPVSSLRRASRVASILATGALAGCAAGGACTAQRVPLAVLNDVPLFHNAPVITATYNGKPVRLVFDTGADTAALTPEAAARIDVPMIRAATFTMQGVNGPTLAEIADGHMLMVAGTHPNLNFGDYIPVVSMISLPVGIDGLLGVAWVREYAFDVDVPHRRVAIYGNDGCNSLPADFPAPGQSADLTSTAGFSASGGFQIPVVYDGRKATAMIDTGAQASVIRRDAAPPGGFAAAAGHRYMTGLGTQRVQYDLVKLRQLQVGGRTLSDVPVVTGPLQAGGEMVLGSDQLSKQRVWYDFGQRRMVFGPRQGG